MSDDKKKEIKVTPYKDGSGAKIDVYSKLEELKKENNKTKTKSTRR